MIHKKSKQITLLQKRIDENTNKASKYLDRLKNLYLKNKRYNDRIDKLKHKTWKVRA